VPSRYEQSILLLAHKQQLHPPCNDLPTAKRYKYSMHTGRAAVVFFTFSTFPIITPDSLANFNLQHTPPCFFVHLHKMPKKYSQW
jgi:hypothetical protein